MSASQFCEHRNLRMRCQGAEEFLDSNIRLIKIYFICDGCGQRFRTVGVHDGMSIDAPTSADNGLTTTMPIVPMGEEPDMDTRGLLS